MPFVPRRIMPSTSALAAFDAVARLGTFSGAALDLSLTQGAISRQVAALEEQLDVQLCERRGGRTKLTADGAVYAKRIAEALAIIREASVSVMTAKQGAVLNLSILPTFGTRWLMPRLPGFIAKHPDIIVNLATRIGQFDFGAEQIDAAIHVGRDDWAGAECRLLMTETVIPVCSPGFFLDHSMQRPQDLLTVPLLQIASRPDAWHHWFSSVGVEPTFRKGMRFEQFLNVAQACIAGLGVALMPPFLVGPELESGQLVAAVPHAIRSTSSYYLAYPRARQEYKPLIAFRDWISAEAQIFNTSQDPHTPGLNSVPGHLNAGALEA